MDTFKNLISKIAQSLGIGQEQQTNNNISPAQPQPFDINNVDFSNIQPIAPTIVPSPVAPQAFDVNQLDFSNIQPIAEQPTQPLFDILPAQGEQLTLPDQLTLPEQTIISSPVTSYVENQQPFDVNQLDFSNITPTTGIDDIKSPQERLADAVALPGLTDAVDLGGEIAQAGASYISSPENINRIENTIESFNNFLDPSDFSNTLNVVNGIKEGKSFTEAIFDKPNTIAASIFPQIKEAAKYKKQLQDSGYDVNNIGIDGTVFSVDNITPTTTENVAEKTNKAFRTKFTDANSAIKFLNTVDNYQKSEQQVKMPLYIPPTGSTKRSVLADEALLEFDSRVKKQIANPDISANGKAYFYTAKESYIPEQEVIDSFRNQGVETAQTSKMWEQMHKGTADVILMNAEIGGRVRAGEDRKKVQDEIYKRYMGSDYIEGSENFALINDNNLTNSVFKKAYQGIPLGEGDRTIKQIASKIKLIELGQDEGIRAGIDTVTTTVGRGLDYALNPLFKGIGLGTRRAIGSLGVGSYAFNVNDVLGTTDRQFNMTSADVAGSYVSEYGAGLTKFGLTVAAGNAVGAGAEALAGRAIPGVLRVGGLASNASRVSKIVAPVVRELAENIPFYFTYGSTFGDNLSKQNLELDLVSSLIVGGFGAGKVISKANKYHSTVFNTVASMQGIQGNQTLRNVTDYLTSKGIDASNTQVLAQYAVDTMDALTKTPEGQNKVLSLRANQTFADKAKKILGVESIEEYKLEYGDVNELKRQYTAIQGEVGLDVEKNQLASKIGRYNQVQTLANTFGTKLEEIFLTPGMDQKMAQFAIMANSPYLFSPQGVPTIKKPAQEATLFDVDNNGIVKEEQYIAAKPKADAIGVDLDTILKKNNDGTYSVPLTNDKETIAKMALVDSSVAKTMIVYNLMTDGCL